MVPRSHLEKVLIEYRDELKKLLERLRKWGVETDIDLSVLEDLVHTVTQDREFAEEYSSLSLWGRLKAKIVPILATFLMELLVAFTFSSFDETIAKYPALAAFLPVISAMSGNNGLISSTVIVRGLATGTETRTLSTILREVFISFLSGIFFGILGSIVCLVFYRSVLMAVVVFLATVMSFTASGFAGSFAPVFFSSIGVDPARFAGPLESNFQDIFTYGVYLFLLSVLPNYIPH